MRYDQLAADRAERMELFDSADPATVKPLDQFPPDFQDYIAAMVAQPRPPGPWMDRGLFATPSRAWFEWYWQRGTRPGMHRRKIPVGVRRAVMERDGSTCQLCGTDVPLDELQLDHIVPYANGGTEAIHNLRVVHGLCNAQRGAPLA